MAILTAEQLSGRRHDRICGELVDVLRKLPLDVTPGEIVVIGESFLVGLALIAIKLGGDDLVLDSMFERAKARLAEIRLKDIKPGGTA